MGLRDNLYGKPQGSVLTPISFIIYTKVLCYKLPVGWMNLFADDMTFINFNINNNIATHIRN